MDLKRTLGNLALAVAIATLSACGQPGAMGVSARQAQALAAQAADPIQVTFNDAYGERTALNDVTARENPYNTDKGLFRLIRGAKTSIDGAFYDIEDLGVAEAMVEAVKRGVRIRLVTDTDNLVEKSDPKKPREAIRRLTAAGVPVVDDKRSAIMHHKFMVVDGKVVWTGSTNLTPSSLYHHNNNALTIRSDDLAEAFTDEFERLFIRHEFGKASRPDIEPVKRIQTSTANIQVFFSPDGGSRDAVVAELARAKKSIRFMTFSLTDRETGQVMLDKAEQGVEVEGIFDRWLAAGQYSLFNPFKAAGLTVYKDGNEALMHDKVIIIDDKTVITGSYNFSINAEENNNEACLIIRSAPRLARAYVQEFKRLIYAARHNHPPAVKKPDVEIPTAETT